MTTDEIVPENLHSISAVTFAEILMMTIDFSAIPDHFELAVSFTDNIIEIHVITPQKWESRVAPAQTSDNAFL